MLARVHHERGFDLGFFRFLQLTVKPLQAITYPLDPALEQLVLDEVRAWQCVRLPRCLRYLRRR